MKIVSGVLSTGILCVLLSGCGGGGYGGRMTGGGNPPASNAPFWAQWGGNSEHTGMVNVAGQSVAQQLANIVYDPFVKQEQAESSGDLLAHYQVPITDGNDVYMEMKTGQYTSCNPPGAWTSGAKCGPNAWQSMIWNEARFTWESGKLVQIWNFASDWKPETNGAALQGWEPVFHAVDANNYIYVPGGGGSIWKVDKDAGTSVSHILPSFFGPANIVVANTFVSSPLTADANGNIYYNVIELADPSQGDPWQNDVMGAWLVMVTPNDVASTVSYSTLVAGVKPPPGNSQSCPGTFLALNDGGASLPWPPTTTAVPPTTTCGSQRPPVNFAPAVAPDGTIYTGSVAHLDSLVSYLVAVNPNLTPKWVASLQNILNDGCGDLISIAPANVLNEPYSCRSGVTPGVDPTTNAPGSGQLIDQSSSTPTVLPDGSVVVGAYTVYNGVRGHLLKFDATGKFNAAFDFGWDSTPAVYVHDASYSIVIKDNHYGASYCFFANPVCQGPAQVYYITQLNPSLQPEWQFQSTNTFSCMGNPPVCVSDHPNGFEWCINAPAIDMNGTVYVNSEDGNIYELPQGNSGIFTKATGNLFLNLALGAAYTPLSIGSDGKLYTQNDGILFVVGN